MLRLYQQRNACLKAATCKSALVRQNPTKALCCPSSQLLLLVVVSRRLQGTTTTTFFVPEQQSQLEEETSFILHHSSTGASHVETSSAHNNNNNNTAHHKKKQHDSGHHYHPRVHHHHHHHHHHSKLRTTAHHHHHLKKMNDHFLSVNERTILAQRNGRVLNVNTLLKVDHYFDQTLLKSLISSAITTHPMTTSSTTSTTSTTATTETIGDLLSSNKGRGKSSSSRSSGVGDPELINHKKSHHSMMRVNDLRFMRLGGAENFRAATLPTPIASLLSASTEETTTTMSSVDPIMSRVFGVAQPTVSGIRAVLNVLGAKKKSVVWINLREEPIIYINSKPHVLRESDHPFQNMSYYSGISVERIEEMEEALKFDIIRESQLYSDNILIHDEIAAGIQHQNSKTTGLVAGTWESISHDSLMTPKQVYSKLIDEGYKVRYIRIPLTAESDFSYQDVDQLISCLRDIEEDAHIVFNCQLGKTRSTHAMVVAWLMDILRDEQRLNRAELLAQQRNLNILKSQKDLRNLYQTGMYKPVLELLRLLQFGSQSKDISDLAIDNCGSVRNLRSAINKFRTKAEKSRNKESRDLFAKIAFKYLSRYYHIIIVADYLRAQLLSTNSNWMTFDEYMRQRSEQNNILMFYKHNPEDALLKTKDELESTLDDVDLVYNRTGKVLSAMTILKRDHFFEPLSDFKETYVGGAPNFRKMNFCNFQIYASATPSIEGFVSILKNENTSQPIHIINLREECLCYINGNPYNLRDIDHPFINLNLIGIKASQLQAIEGTLKEDCLSEITRDSKLLLHDETKQSELVSFWEQCSADSIQTPVEVMDSLAKFASQVNYHHIPITALTCPTFDDVDGLHSALCVVYEKGENVLFYDHFGLGRCFFALVISTLYIHTREFYFGGMLRDECIKSVDPYNSSILDYNASATILRLIPDSLRRVSEVNYAMQLCQLGAGALDFRKDVEMEILTAQTSRTSSTSDIHLKRAGQMLKKYLLMVVYSAYLHNQVKEQHAVAFSDWMMSRPEIAKALASLDSNPASALKKMKLEVSQEKPYSETRLGEVLARRTLLKHDHFPGCQRKQLLPHIEGAPNFRQIGSQYGQIYGVAIPTKTGIENVLNLLKAKQNQVVWINLREEPLVYINNEPYCLRDIDRPFENIIQAGITSDRVENMEDRLKHDILKESETTNNSILSHDETDDMQPYTHYIPIDNESIVTLRDIYHSKRQEGYLVDFYRIPITDERAPDPDDFDAIVRAAVSANPHTTHFVANCQMGRGRTTTCLVVLALINSWRLNAYDLTKELVESNSPPSPIADPSQNLRNGNYRIITKLMRVLKYGPRNKSQVDKVIDNCSHMQNLRTTIYDCKLQSIPEAKQPKTAKHEFAHERGINYLERYALLIIFNEWLHEELSQSERKPFSVTFKDWLASRAELNNILQSQMKLE